MFLTLGTASSFANGVTNNLETISSFISKTSTTTKDTKSALPWYMVTTITTTTTFFCGYPIFVHVTTTTKLVYRP